MSRHRNWCFTLNNPTEEECVQLRDLLVRGRYAIVGNEVGENGTPHLQGYTVFLHARGLSSVKAISERAHWEPAKGNSLQNYEYCSKEGNIFLEHGDRPCTPKEKGQKEKDRWKLTVQLAKEGRIDEIEEQHFLQYYRTLRMIEKDYMKPVSDHSDVTGVWIYGEAGVGKSRKARDDYPNAYLKMCNKWWDGYQNEDAVIIDDIDTAHKVLGHHLKIWSDRYAFLAEIKGGTKKIRPKVVCVTSQYSIEDIWDDDATRDALNRRFRVIKLN